MIKKYRIEKIIDGLVIGHRGDVIAVPFSSDHTRMVTHPTGYMIIKKKQKPLAVRTFPDKFGRDKIYRLYYFPWKPTVPKQHLSVFEALVKAKQEPQQLQII